MIEARAVAEEHIGSFYNERKVDRRTQALRQDAGRLDITDGLRPLGYDIGTMAQTMAQAALRPVAGDQPSEAA